MADEVKFKQDNPGGDWLRRKQEHAEDGYSHHKGLTGAVTGYFSHTLHLPTKHLKDIPGARGEENYRNDFSSSKHQELSKSVKQHGFNSKEHAILIGINHRGKPHVLEGNHRLAHAIKHGHEKIHADVRYWNGGEDVKGHGFHPDQVLHLHNHGEYKGLEEEVHVNSAGAGHIAAIGIGPEGEPPGIPASKRRRKNYQMSTLIRRWMNGR